MKRRAILVVCLVLFLAAGCDLFQARSYKEIQPSNIPASGGTAPADQDESLSLFLGFYEEFLAGGMARNVSAKGVSPAGRDFESVLKAYIDANSINAYKADELIRHSVVKADLGYTGPVGAAGSADLKGGFSATFPYLAGEEPELQIDTQYADLVRVLLNLDIFGTIENLEMDDYVLVKAIMNNNAEASVRADLKTGLSEPNPMIGATVKLNAAFKLKMSEAYSIKRKSDGKGAKFVITADVNAAKPDIEFTFGVTPDFDDLMQYLGRIVLTVKVYDDSDQIRGETEIPLGLYLFSLSWD